MAEYYAVLSKAVAGLENNGADTRRAVYDKARNALIGQLKAIEPPLPTAEISRQRLELEEAIRRVEREAAAAVKTTPRAVPATARSGAAAVQRAPAQRQAKPSPQDVFRRAIQEAESAGERAPQPDRAPVVARVEDWSVEETAEAPEQQIEAPRAARPQQLPARKAETYLPSQGYVEEPPRPDEPRLAPDYDYEWDPDSTSRPAAAVARDSAPDVVANDFRARPRRPQRASRDRVGHDNDDRVDALERRARPSSLPTILLLVLIGVMLLGLAALAWSQRAIISDLLGGFDSHEAAAPVAPAPDTSAKDSDSLLGSNQDNSTADTSPAGSVRVVTPGGPQTDASTPPAVTPVPAPQDNVVPAAGALVAQKATLYEEPLDNATAQNGVVAIKAAVTWSAVQDSDGPQIVGNIDVPDRGMKLKVTFRQNHDKTLPASHVVEIVVQVPPDFPGKGIQDVPRIVMKPTEDGRGQPLVGASAKVADGFFWVALSNVQADLSANLGLLKQLEWFDLPVVYATGQRAVVTLEKGTSGDRVFDQVLAAWATGG